MAHAHGFHDHAHDHSHGPGPGHGHDHSLGPGGHHHGPGDTGDWRYAVGLLVNLAFVAVEFGAGIVSGSTALMADAGHNLSDVMGLAMAGGAAWLARRASGPGKTYGYGKATVLAALANALLLIFACGAIAFEAVRRLAEPAPVMSGLSRKATEMGSRKKIGYSEMVAGPDTTHSTTTTTTSTAAEAHPYHRRTGPRRTKISQPTAATA
jgi:cobalt-zinc-cadmium efflux system protein